MLDKTVETILRLGGSGLRGQTAGLPKVIVSLIGNSAISLNALRQGIVDGRMAIAILFTAVVEDLISDEALQVSICDEALIGLDYSEEELKRITDAIESVYKSFNTVQLIKGISVN